MLIAQSRLESIQNSGKVQKYRCDDIDQDKTEIQAVNFMVETVNRLWFRLLYHFDKTRFTSVRGMLHRKDFQNSFKRQEDATDETGLVNQPGNENQNVVPVTIPATENGAETTMMSFAVSFLIFVMH